MKTIDEIINEICELSTRACPAPWDSRYVNSAGHQIHAPMPRTEHVEYTLRAGMREIVGSKVLLGYGPWVQFSNSDYTKIMDANYALIGCLRNNADALIQEIISLRVAAKKYHEERGQCSWGYDHGDPCPLCAILK